MAPKRDLRITQAFAAILLLMIVFLIQLEAVASNTSAPTGCRDNCGGIPVPYPFGIDPGCALKGFELSCNMTSGGSQTLFFRNATVLNVSLSAGQILVKQNISSYCYNHVTRKVKYTPHDWYLYGTPYRINNVNNKFTAVGCDSLSLVALDAPKRYQGGCVISGCYKPGSSINTDGPCSGLGCCQTAIPGTQYYWVGFDENYYNPLHPENFSWCSYSMVTVADGLGFNKTFYTNNYTLHEQQVPLLLDWAIGNKTCDTAQTDKTSYMCRSINSVCIDSRNGPGYMCNCSDGYEGNPYNQGGCQDIDECAKENPCKKRKCHNLPGSYICSCPLLMRPQPDTTDHQACQLYVPYLIGVTLALGFGIGLLILLSYFAIAKRIKLFEKRRQEKIKHKFFIQNRGLLLQQLIDSHDDITEKTRIFRLDELEKATNRFDDALILGRGGHGKVYKGILSDQRVVAIKRSTNINKAEIDQFINEVVILSRVNHRNVVKLFGCCLETEVPLLVYEFVSNGTLSHHLHAQEHCSLTWQNRLRIALEAAGAISYLHSSASISVLHRDIKSANILLDDYFTTKVSDFGISRSVQLDQTGTNTKIEGTLGYIDPEYLRTGRLTQKSDVYSFGVILVEFLTREKPIGSSRMFEGGSLIAYFKFAMRENRLFEIIDPEVVYEENRTELEEVAKIAEMCISRTGEERPTMKEVEMQLQALWQSNKKRNHPCTSQSSEESQLMPLDIPAEIDTTYYSFQIEPQSNIPR